MLTFLILINSVLRESKKKYIFLWPPITTFKRLGYFILKFDIIIFML